MKLRRALLAFVVLAGFLVLILGVTGVLSPKKPQPVASKAAAESPARKENVIDEFEIKGDTWRLKADQARPNEDGSLKLIKPVLEVTQSTAAGQERLAVQASEGALQLEPEKRVHMSGGVRVEFIGAERIVLTTPSVEVAPDQGTGRTPDEVEMVVDSAEGRQRLWGKGAEFNAKQRRIVVSENIRIELSGAAGGLFPLGAGLPAKAGEPAGSGTPNKPAGTPSSAGKPVTKIVCRGPATADGFTRTAELNGDVRVQQGENTLRADRLETQFAENSRTPERFAAEGAVTFQASGAEGACDRLARSAAEDQFLLEGKPARVRRGPNEIEATRIELSGQKGVIVVPVPGRLKLAGEAAAPPAEAMTVNWSRMLRLDSDRHQALFLGDVHFAGGDRTIECQTLTVTLDSENRRILKCTADTDVRLAANMPGAAGPEPVTGQARELAYDPEKDSILLTGGAALKQGQRTIRGERIEIHPKDAGIAVSGAGVLEGAAEKGPERFSISWGREMRFSRATQSAVFAGGVGMKYGGDTLRAESVTARLSENALKGFDAAGGVELHQTGRVLKADRLSADMGADQKPLRLDASGHVAIRDEVEREHLTRTLTADRVVSATDEKTQLQGYEATGQVALREDAGPGGVRTMRADRITAKVDAANQLETFEGAGRPVTVEGEGRLALGDRLTWDAQRDSGTLFGAPAEVRMGQSRLFGDRVEFAPKRGAITIISNRRVEAAIVGGAPGTTNLLTGP
jgi:lipopolysaccharide transport protein LptA